MGDIRVLKFGADLRKYLDVALKTMGNVIVAKIHHAYIASQPN